jgi:6-pyruvoyltetrahydropterin/6-carboxytetrahydropterin synthase
VYSIKVEAIFSAAHSLRGYKGKCESLHGHNWKVEVELRRAALDPCGMVIDFTVVKKKLKKQLEILDHTHLNQIPYFKKVNPTSENIAHYLFDALNKQLSCVYSVTVWESEHSAATYYGS